jgi:hypothetical protein
MIGSFRAACAAAGLLGVLGAATVVAADPPGLDAKAAFVRLKSLDGEWKTTDDEHGGDAKVVYRIVSGGSTVMEALFPGSKHEMVSMYFLDGDELRMTHYCSLGNQPQLKLDKKSSRPVSLVFAFDGGTNFDPQKDMHIHSLKIDFKDKSHVEAEWESYRDGKKDSTMKFIMKRP